MVVASCSFETAKTEDLNADLLIVGGGGCGLAAAVTGAEKGANVILLEKRSIGGNSAMAVGLFAVESLAQRRLSISTSRDEVFKIATDYSHWKINPRIFRAFVDRSADTIQWLENMGLKFNNIPYVYPTHNLRTYHCLEYEKAGSEIVKLLRKRCKDLGVRLFTRCPVKKILINKKGSEIGVLATMKDKQLKITAKSVIIATGGYGSNKELLKRYCSSYIEKMIYLGVPMEGDGLLMAMEAGAATEGLGTLMLHTHIFPGSKYVNAISQEPFTIFVSENGERFLDETITFKPPECGNAIDRQPNKCVYSLFDEKIKNIIIKEGLLKGGMNQVMGILTTGNKVTPGEIKLTDAGTKLPNLGTALQLEADKGDVKISNSCDEISKWMRVDPHVLKNTIEEYNSFCDNGYDMMFAKERRYLLPLRNPPYYGVRCYLSFLTTIGGIKINHQMEVIGNHGDIIPGLYAGGDVTGGWESDTYCMSLGGSAFGFAINSGRIAGENATKYILAKYPGN
jgi:fumarate reductase flavoprotein subunit